MSDDGFLNTLGWDGNTNNYVQTQEPPPQTYEPVVPYSTQNVPVYDGGGWPNTTQPPPETFGQSVQQNIDSDPLLTYVADTSNAINQLPDTVGNGAQDAGLLGKTASEPQSFGSQAIDWLKQSIGWTDATAANPKPDNSLQLSLLNMGGNAIAGGLLNAGASRRAQESADLARYNAETQRKNVDANVAAQQIVDQKNLKELNKYKSYGNVKINKKPITGKVQFN